MNPWTIALIGFIGAILGSGYGYWQALISARKRKDALDFQTPANATTLMQRAMELCDRLQVQVDRAEANETALRETITQQQLTIRSLEETKVQLQAALTEAQQLLANLQTNMQTDIDRLTVEARAYQVEIRQLKAAARPAPGAAHDTP